MGKVTLIAVVISFLLHPAKLCGDQLSGVGNFLGSFVPPTPTPKQKAAEEAQRLQTVQTLLKGHYFRRVNGQIVNMFLNGNLTYFIVESKINGFVIGKGFGKEALGRIAVKNFTGEVIAKQSIEFVAVRSGSYDDGGTPLELYDCGRILTADEEQNEIERLKKQHATAQQQVQADRQVKKKIEDAKAAEATAKAVKINQDQADKGDAYGLLRMGERYRTGVGVEKDLEKARSYLQKAVNAGSETAKSELADLLEKGK